MKKQEAIKLMKKGEKLTHPELLTNEWVTISNDDYYFKDGNCCSERGFWKTRANIVWEDGWEIAPENW
jgi:hypothetical protein